MEQVIFVIVFQHDLMNHFIWHEPGGGEAPVTTSYLPSLLCRAVVPRWEHAGAGKGMVGLISTCRRECGEGAESLEGCRMLMWRS